MWRNELEAFIYNQKNYINDAMEGKLSEADKEKLSKTVEDALVWLEDHPAAGKDEYDPKPKEVEHVVNPIIKTFSSLVE
jgi:molecular chaperone DnaK (HSP70)